MRTRTFHGIKPSHLADLAAAILPHAKDLPGGIRVDWADVYLDARLAPSSRSCCLAQADCSGILLDRDRIQAAGGKVRPALLGQFAHELAHLVADQVPGPVACRPAEFNVPVRHSAAWARAYCHLVHRMAAAGIPIETRTPRDSPSLNSMMAALGSEPGLSWLAGSSLRDLVATPTPKRFEALFAVPVQPVAPVEAHQPASSWKSEIIAMAASIAPDFPRGSVRVLDSSECHDQAAPTWLGWTSDAYRDAKSAAIVLNIEGIRAAASAMGFSPASAVRGVAIHELSHVLQQAAPGQPANPLPSVSDYVDAIAAASRVGLAPVIERDIHSAQFGRCLAHLYTRACAAGYAVAARFVWAEELPSLTTMVDVLREEIKAYGAGGGSLRSLATMPTPPAIRTLFALTQPVVHSQSYFPNP